MNDQQKWEISDIEGLHVHVPEVDPRLYFDQREYAALQRALITWPALARLMGLAPKS